MKKYLLKLIADDLAEVEYDLKLNMSIQKRSTNAGDYWIKQEISLRNKIARIKAYRERVKKEL